MKNIKPDQALALISLHGGHSADFCQHAEDPLDQILATYAALGFTTVGITEHMPPTNDQMRYPDEADAGLAADAMRDRFDRYFETARRLQREYKQEMQVLIGFETEWYPDALPLIKTLIAQHTPDYIVGSVHHVNEVCFDFDEEHYVAATAAAGGLDSLYTRYFDLQLEMINALSPAIVGHFDLIRIFDPDYANRLQKPAVAERINRNLKTIREKDLLLDMNTRAYMKGATEPYPCRAIIAKARELGITMAPGDDSHGVPSVGYKIEQAIHILDNLGFDTDWNTIIKRVTLRP